MKITVVLILFLFGFVACNTPKKTTESKLQNQVSQKKPLPDSLYRFTVSFISIGSGTDKNAKQQFIQFIQQFNEKNNVKVNAEIANWGREGETDYCLKLSELNKQQQNQFLTETKEVLKNSALIRYEENCFCRHKPQR
jgi:maltose-binding protein MalE